MKVGIQGGPGSFNDAAARANLPLVLDTDFELIYLYTTANVLEALEGGRVERGQFAISNTLGGIVDETTNALKDHSYRVLSEYTLRVRHSLLYARGATASTIASVMGHPQALTQCKNSLAFRHAELSCVAGEGRLSDPAAIADAICNNQLPPTTAVLGSATLAEHFSLDILDTDLQDSDDNHTTFVLVTR